MRNKSDNCDKSEMKIVTIGKGKMTSVRSEVARVKMTRVIDEVTG